MDKEKGYQSVENTSDSESNNEESSWDIESQEEEEEMASENGVEAEGTQESDNDTENDSQETESSSPETSTTFHSKRPCEHCENSNVYGTLIMKCPKFFWHDYYKICPICDHQDSRGEKLQERGLSSVSRLWSSYTQQREDVGNQFLFPSYRGELRRGLIYFHSLTNRCVFDSFCHCF